MDAPKPDKSRLPDDDLQKVKDLAHHIVVALSKRLEEGNCTLGQGMGGLMIAVAAVAQTMGVPDDLVLGALSEAITLVRHSAGRFPTPFAAGPKTRGDLN